MKKTIFLLYMFICGLGYSQNKQVLYGFADLPQNLLLNPGSEANYKYHFGFPLLSGVSLNAGNTAFSMSDLFAKDNLDINNKLSGVLNNLSNRDNFTLNFQLDVLNGGFRLDKKTYLSFGFYQELDAVFYYPTDFMNLAYEGNFNHINRTYQLSQFLTKMDLSGVLHFGVSREINKDLTLGARLKVYSSALNAQTVNNAGTFTTADSNQNIIGHYLDDIDVALNTSGLEGDIDAGSSLGGTFLGANKGLGIDLGVTYNISDKLEFSASLLDLGYVKHKKSVKNYTLKGDFNVEGIEYDFDTATLVDYWLVLGDRFEEEIATEENTNSYITGRPTKFNASLKYGFGKIRSRYCYDRRYLDFHANHIGVHFNSIFRPLYPQLALTTFYQRAFSNKVFAKVTYTIDQYSFHNIGAGATFQVGPVGFYAVLDNILSLKDVSSANSLSAQVGVNFVFY